ncbi:hypothetical protein T439DRAFT_336651 [Meredithblackwellia eburnea MCA 4105]
MIPRLYTLFFLFLGVTFVLSPVRASSSETPKYSVDGHGFQNDCQKFYIEFTGPKETALVFTYRLPKSIVTNAITLKQAGGEYQTTRIYPNVEGLTKKTPTGLFEFSWRIGDSSTTWVMWRDDGLQGAYSSVDDYSFNSLLGDQQICKEIGTDGEKWFSEGGIPATGY